MENNFYFAITGTSKHSNRGAQYAVNVLSDTDIIELANNECEKDGQENLFDIAGIKMIGFDPDSEGNFEQFEPERPFKPGEELDAAVQKLDQDGKKLMIFNMDSEKETNEFVEEAKMHDQIDDAIELIEKFDRNN